MSEKFTKKIWEENIWTNQATNIIERLGKFPAYTKINIIMRHSQRHEPKLVNVDDYGINHFS